MLLLLGLQFLVFDVRVDEESVVDIALSILLEEVLTAGVDHGVEGLLLGGLLGRLSLAGFSQVAHDGRDLVFVYRLLFRSNVVHLRQLLVELFVEMQVFLVEFILVGRKVLLDLVFHFQLFALWD